MRIIIKIILCLVVLVIATPISVLAKQAPFMNLILVAGLFGAFRAIWKYNPDKQNEDDKNKSLTPVKDENLDKS
jgi:hypothetical protein